MNLRKFLDSRVLEAMKRAGVHENANPQVRPSAKKEFGDYQANGIMPVAKALKMNPRQLAEKVVSELQHTDFAEKVEVAGPGFINIFLKKEWLSEELGKGLQDERMGISKVKNPEKVVIDFSSPNLAKEMHVGHLRSTIIGDAIARVLEYLGHDVTPQNHVGDWGTGFGMLIAKTKRLKQEKGEQFAYELSDLESFYVAAKKDFDSDPQFAEESRNMVVRFQGGDKEALALWRSFIEISLKHCEEVYQRLGVRLSRDHVRGESFYNPELPSVVEDLRQKGFVTEDNGAQCVFLDEFKGKDNAPLPIIIKKSDGGYLYMTTDLAAIRYRSHTLGANRLLYVIDSRQALHMNQLFTLAGKSGYLPPHCHAQHLAFGMVLGKDGKPYKTRAGGVTKLTVLLDEAQERAFQLVKEKNPDHPLEELQNIARVVGLSSVKYADLSKNRISDYVFDFDNMLSFEGNTAPYMLYAYARIASLLRKAGVRTDVNPVLTEPAEKALALEVLRFEETLNAVAAEGYPHYLCTYLFDLAGSFMTFYEACPVLNASEEVKQSRLRLCEATARTLKQGLELLGLETLERM